MSLRRGTKVADRVDVVTVVVTSMETDGGRWLPSFFYRSRQSFITVVLYSLEIEIIDTNNVDFFHTFIGDDDGAIENLGDSG